MRADVEACCTLGAVVSPGWSAIFYYNIVDRASVFAFLAADACICGVKRFGREHMLVEEWVDGVGFEACHTAFVAVELLHMDA